MSTQTSQQQHHPQSSSMQTSTQIKKATTKLEEVIASGGQLTASNPIILVFPQPSAGSISLENAKEFLLNGK